MTAFGGFPRELFSFFDGLSHDNSRTYWNANKAIWQECVRDPMQALLDELAAEFGPLRMFRPNRDVRFSADKSPYKLWAGATSEARAVGGIGYYLSVSASQLVTGYGAMAMAPDQLRRYRGAIDDDSTGREFEELLTTLADRSLPVTPGAQPPLKVGPRGYPATHPRSELLRWKGAAVVQEYKKADWMYTPVVLDTIRGVWRGVQPLKEWLDTRVAVDSEPGSRASAGTSSGHRDVSQPGR
ncbi:DUF2461 domain-containing protein [Phytoactinopolyspora mesophila]|uniref:DUF2461 family protein n=1 Tax=Phytoactinopolyspora mesophila TaxID=2650750 RepID=A0A7K3LXL1_9ACTN|nr:DUF2461 domain-containing protein [Phytoactinopolyspora mesophila]NDL55756.1 DUF2461 family protein [Phytoactinopolyspora mesophila]